MYLNSIKRTMIWLTLLVCVSTSFVAHAAEEMLSFADLRQEFLAAKTSQRQAELMRKMWSSYFIESEHAAFLTSLLKHKTPQVRYYAAMSLYNMQGRLAQDYEYDWLTEAMLDVSFEFDTLFPVLVKRYKGKQRGLLLHLEDVLKQDRLNLQQRLRVVELLMSFSKVMKQRGEVEMSSHIYQLLYNDMFERPTETRIKIAYMLLESRGVFTVDSPALLRILKNNVERSGLAVSEKLDIYYALFSHESDAGQRMVYGDWLSLVLQNDTIAYTKRKSIALRFHKGEYAYIQIPFFVGVVQENNSQEQVELASGILVRLLRDIHLQRDKMLFNRSALVEHENYDLIFPVMKSLMQYPVPKVRRQALEIMALLSKAFFHQDEEVIRAYMKNPQKRIAERAEAVLLYKEYLAQEEAKKRVALKNAPVPGRPKLAPPPPPIVSSGAVQKTAPAEKRFPTMSERRGEASGQSLP